MGALIDNPPASTFPLGIGVYNYLRHGVNTTILYFVYIWVGDKYIPEFSD